MKNEDIVDLFNEELSKKEKRQEKKIAKMKAKDKKKQEKKMKKLEKMEDIEFAKKIKEKEELKYTENKNLNKEKQILKREKENYKVEKKHTFLNFLLGFFMIILFLVTIDYFLYNVIKSNDLYQIINSSLLCIMVLFYLLSILISNISVKKFFQILATIAIAAFMAYHLWVI